MDKCKALIALLKLEPLTRKQMRDITGWTEKQLANTILSLSHRRKIVVKNRLWIVVSLNKQGLGKSISPTATTKTKKQSESTLKVLKSITEETVESVS